MRLPIIVMIVMIVVLVVDTIVISFGYITSQNHTQIIDQSVPYEKL